MKNRKRILAAILTAIMTISILPANSFASEAGENDTAEAAEEAVIVSDEEQDVESTVEDVSEETASETEEEPSVIDEAEEVSEPETTEEVETVTEEEDFAAEETVEADEVVETVEDDIETVDTESEGPKTLKAEGKDYIVTVTYNDSALLPDDVKIEVEEIKETARKYDDYCDQALEAIQENGSDADKLNYVRLFDIKLVDSTGAKAEPEGKVDVQISLKDLKDEKKADEAMQVVHFGEKATEVINPDVEGDTLAFETEGFSIYAVLTHGETGDDARLKVIFMNGETEFKSIYVKKADVTNGKLNEVLYDPGEPESAEGKTFLGWTDQSSYNMDTVRKTIDDVRTAVSTMLNSGVKEGDSVTYYAIMFKAFSLYYQDRYENTYRTESLLTTGDSVTTTVNQEYTVQGSNPSEGFVGWVVKGTETTEGHTVYKNGDPITISQDTTLIPEIGQGAWLFFDSNAGGAGVSEASYTAPKFIPVGETPTEPAAPTRPGYTFAGWFEGPEDSAATFDFDKQMTEHTAAADGKIYAYAHWTPNPTGSYKVVIWAQKVTDDKNAADSAKTYDYVATYTVNDAVAGTVLTEEELRQSSNNYFTKNDAFFGATDLKHGSKAFEYRTFTVDHGIGANGNGVSPDDSTVVNVYYDRKLLTLFFQDGSGTVSHDYYYEVTDGENVYGLVNGEYVPLDVTVSNRRIEFAKEAGNLDLPASITQVKLASNSTEAGDEDTINVSDLYSPRGQSAGKLINEIIGFTGTQARKTSKSMRLNIYTTDSRTPLFGATRYCQLNYTVKGDYSYKYNGETYTGKKYAKQTITGTEYTGLYGQTMAQNGYTWPTPSGADSWHGLSWLQAFRGNLFGSATLGLGAGTGGGIPNVIIAKTESNPATSTIIFWFEKADAPGQYEEVGRVKFYFESDSRYNITERVLGGTFNGYQWTTSESMPGNWSYNVGSDGFTTDECGSNTYMHIRYDRATYDIVYMQGNTTLKTESDVPYEASLSDYADTVPADSAVTVGENEFFRGWFEDPEGVKRVDWTGKMPAGNKIIYAVVAKAQYHVVIDMDGGTLPNDQSTEFWEYAGNIIDDTNFKGATKTDDQGNVYTLVGYFLDENYTKQWNFSARLNEEDLWHKYDDTNGDDPYRDSDFFEKGNDVGWYNVSGIFRLFAQWKNEDILSKGGLHIKYVNPDGTLVSTDPMHYADQVDVRAADAPAASFVPEGKRFDGWQLKEGKVYQPTEIFVADSEDAVLDPSLGDNGEYWITLTAVYVDKEEKTPTHIYFYKNDGVATEPIRKYDNVDINVGYAICDAPTRDGYEFLGWARDIETPVDAQGKPEIDPETGDVVINKTSTKTEADFLEYRDGKYFDPNTNTEVTEVAADEVLPYHGLYAIWKRDQFHIYHSFTGKTQDVDMPNQGRTIDLTDYVTEGKLYGGYYHYDEGVDGKRSKGDAYPDNGKELTPHKGTYYYLKEVDAGYLKPQIYLVWNTNHDDLIVDLYGFVDVDAVGDYTDCGLIMIDPETEETIEEITTHETMVSGNIDVMKGTQKYDSLTISSLFKMEEGDFGMEYLSYYIEPNALLEIRGYYVTPDGVKVTGFKDRMVQFGPGVHDGMPVHKGWNVSGSTFSGLKEVGTTAKKGALNSMKPMTAKRSLTLSVPSDEEGYTITKVYDSGTEEQTVEGGDHTGEISYTAKDGYMFAGWYLDEAFTAPADFSDVSSDMTVYARYISSSDISVGFTRKYKISNITAFNATVSVKGQDALQNVSITVNGSDSAVLSSRTVKKSGSGKNVKYVSTYKGLLKVKGLSLTDTFTAAVSWVTPDGTVVNGSSFTCSYALGIVTLK